MAESEVAALVELSSRFSAGTLTATESERLSEIAQGPMARNFQIPFTPAETLTTQSSHVPEDQLRGLWHELAQHLRDLRYLSERAFISYHQHKTRVLYRPEYLLPILEAVHVYLKEDTDWTDLVDILPFSRPIDLLWLGKHLPKITERLGQFTAWDGRSTIPEKYRPGDENVNGRSLAYRLRTLSSPQFPFAESAYFLYGQVGGLNELFTKGFSVAGQADDKKLPIGYWRHLGDIDLLMRRYIRNTSNRVESALLYQLDREPASPTPLDQLPDEAFTVAQLPSSLYDLSKAREMIRKAKRRRDREDDGLDVRLLQIKLWQTGYYIGAVDGEWGSLSHEALKVFISDQASETAAINSPPRKKDIKRAARIRSMLLPANREHLVYVADFKAIIRLFDGLQVRYNIPEEEDLAAQVEDIRKEASVSDEELDTRVLTEAGLAKLYPDIVSNANRRVAFPKRGVIRWLWGGVRKVVRWLKKGVTAVVQELLGPVFTFVKSLLRPIRLAVSQFFTGFRYLANFVFGRPLISDFPGESPGDSSIRFATSFSLDFDARTLVPSRWNRGQAKLHAMRLDRMREDMFYFIDTIVYLVKAIGRLTNPGGWVWLGLKLFKLLGAVMRQRKDTAFVT